MRGTNFAYPLCEVIAQEFPMLSSPFPLNRAIVFALLTTWVSGCAHSSSAGPAAHLDDYRELSQQNPPILAPLTLDDSIQRGLAFNATYRASRDRASIQLAATKPNWLDPFPNVILNSNISTRSNQEASVGQRVNEMGRALGKDFFTASDQTRANAQAVVAWDMLDAGLWRLQRRTAQLQAEQAELSNQIACGVLTTEITSAFWHARAKQNAESNLKWLESRVSYGLELSKASAIKDPSRAVPELQFQRELIDLFRWYRSIYQSVVDADAELSNLINVPTGTSIEVDKSQTYRVLKIGERDFSHLIVVAFENRPELLQNEMRGEIVRIQNREEIAKLFPRLALNLSENADSNSYFLNDRFLSASVQLSVDVVNLLDRKGRRKKAENRLTNHKRDSEVVASAVVAQIGIALAEYEAREASLELAWRAEDVQAQLVKAAIEQSQKDPELQRLLIKEELLGALAALRRDVDLAAHQAAEARVRNSAGMSAYCRADQVNMRTRGKDAFGGNPTEKN